MTQPFDPSALLEIIKRLVHVDARWIPNAPGCSLYLRPTIIGTRPALGVAASDHAILYVIASPTGPMFRVPRPIALLGVHEHARAWPGGTGAYKLGLNYAPGFLPQRRAAQKGYDQVLWLLDEQGTGKPENCRITEAGAMNFFVVLAREDGDLDVITPPLDGTILPGLTRASCLELVGAHPTRTTLPGLAPEQRLHVAERRMTMADLVTWGASGTLREIFCVGTAVIVAPVGRVGFEGQVDVVLPEQKDSPLGLGPVGAALRQRVDEIQTGRIEWEGWSVVCE
jgi:branched-chain amino acid aminotransferase